MKYIIFENGKRIDYADEIPSQFSHKVTVNTKVKFGLDCGKFGDWLAANEYSWVTERNLTEHKTYYFNDKHQAMLFKIVCA